MVSLTLTPPVSEHDIPGLRQYHGREVRDVGETYKLDAVAFSTWSSRDEFDAVNHADIIEDPCRWRNERVGRGLRR